MKKSAIFLVLFLLLSPMIPVSIYFHNNWYSFFGTWSLGIFFGIVSFTYIIEVIILSCRIPFFDRTMGHDKVMVLHGYLALAAIASALVHKVLKEIYLTEESFQVKLGEISFSIFLLITLVTLLLMVQNMIHKVPFLEKIRAWASRKIFFDYTVLKAFHNLTVLAAVIACVHVILAASTQESYLRVVFFGIFFGAAFLLYLYHKIFRVLLMKQRKYTVREVVKENGTITSVLMEEGARRLKHKAGQFAFFRFLSKEVAPTEHPFTISSSPNSPLLSVTAKNLGNFTARIPDIKQGDGVLLDGPYGVFSPFPSKRDLVFIAGGIGITPFMSIVNYWVEQKLETPITLIWACRFKDDLIRGKEFEEYARQNTNFTFLPILSDEKDFDGARGYITKEWLNNVIPDQLKRDGASFYICGPGPMLSIVRKLLNSLGIKGRRIHYESFSL